jgi:hypothetical protein
MLLSLAIILTNGWLTEGRTKHARRCRREVVLTAPENHVWPGSRLIDKAITVRKKALEAVFTVYAGMNGGKHGVDEPNTALQDATGAILQRLHFYLSAPQDSPLIWKGCTEVPAPITRLPRSAPHD